MSDRIGTVDRWATKLGVRPVATRMYWLWRDARDALREFRYRQYRLRNDTYRVTVGDARADFHVLSRQEYLDLVRLPERPILADLLSELRRDDVFYDLGSNIGLYSCLVASVVEPTVVAFEPHPKNAERLAQNRSLNESALSLQRVAIAASSGTAQMRLSPGFDIDTVGSAGHTLLTEYYDEDSGVISTEKRRGDEFVAEAEHPPPTVLKIDTEGTEMDVLQGFDSTLARPECRLVYCEVHEDRLRSQGRSVSDIRAFLESHGFSAEERSVADCPPFVRAEKPG